MASLADYANNPEVVAYLKALQAQQQPGVTGVANSTDVVPFDAGLTAANNAAQYGYNNTIAQIGAQEPLIRRQYGYTQTGDVDPSNPFGKAQLLKRSYDQAQKGNTNSYAARGQLYSGALQRAKNESQFNYQSQDAALRGQYGQELAGLQAQRAEAANRLAMSKAGNYWDWVQGQIAARAAMPTTEPSVGEIGAGMAGSAQPTLATYANDPEVVAYLKARYAASQAPQPTNLFQPSWRMGRPRQGVSVP